MNQLFIYGCQRVKKTKLLFLAIAMSNTDDVRPVLDYYKEQGGNILETFKGNID